MRSAGRRKLLPAVLIFVGTVSGAAGQIALSPGSTVVAPESPPAAEGAVSSLPAVEVEPAPAALVHAFWDRTNRWLLAGVAFARGMDYASTRNMRARGRKEILLPPEVVNNWAAFASLEEPGPSPRSESPTSFIGPAITGWSAGCRSVTSA